jgi:uncharacterized membrane protein (UPF0127 family)
LDLPYNASSPPAHGAQTRIFCEAGPLDYLGLYPHVWIVKLMRLYTDIGVFEVDVAANPAIGLLGRRKLRRYEAMLLEFPFSDFWGVHTMGMNYPIDIVWLDKDNMIVDKTTLSAETPGVYPDLPAVRVLEFNAGIAAIAGFNIGEHLTLSTTN